ncbi:MAG: hypothetical protein K2M83_00270 [Muribaculaceae bacterium]|nr:hypothetical protein [Muribaculaceae bacterium]
MKKKVLYGAALALFASVSMGTLQSCKDDLSDFEHKTQYDNKVLTDQINALKTALEDCKSNCASEIASLKTSISNLQKQIADNKDDADATKKLVQKLEQDLRALSDKVALMYTNDKIDEMLGNLKQLVEKYNDEQTEANATLKVALESTISEEVGKINGLIDRVKEEIQKDYNQKFDNLKDEFASKTEFNTLVDKVTTLEETTKTQQAAIEAAQNEINELWMQMNSQNELINQVYQSLTDELNELGAKYDEVSKNLDQLTQDIYGTGGLQEQMVQLYNSLRDELTAEDEEIWKTIEAVREEASMYWRATEATFEELRNEDEQLWLAIAGPGGLQEQLAQVLNAHAADIEALENEIAELNTKYDNLLGRMNKLITGILLQATDNPVFGDFSLPIGVKNNMLFNWYGYNSSLIKNFPTSSNAYAYNDQEVDVNFAALGVDTEAVQQGFLGNVNLGRVYLTVNPVGHNFDNTKFTLETSAGKALPFGLKISKSEDELFFGYTRANNGFYAADVIIDGDQNALNKGISATKLTIDDQLKSAVKDVLKDRSKRNAVNLLKAVYNQMSDQLPAYAVRYDWTDEEGNPYAVLSNYDLAIASAKPLSYQFFYGQSISKHLPTIGHIDNFIYKLKENGGLHFDFSNSIDLGKANITLPSIDISTTVDPVKAQINVTIGEIIVKDTEGNILYNESPDVKVDGVQDLADDITNSIQKALDDIQNKLGGWSEDANTQINDEINSMFNNIQTQINDMMADISGDINDKIDDIFDNLGNKAQPWFDRLNKLVDLYNKVAGKINNVLDNPNHYLQVAMFYNQADSNFGMLSNSKKSPTVFKGGNGNVGLYASSYTAELVAPAFKKYVAVSNVYNADGSNYDGAQAAMNKVNGSNHFNEVVDGNTIRYSIPASQLEKNKIYEIVYQGLDFHGVTSTQKFYITVK